MQFSILLTMSEEKEKNIFLGKNRKSNMKENLLLINSQAHSLPKTSSNSNSDKEEYSPGEKSVRKI